MSQVAVVEGARAGRTGASTQRGAARQVQFSYHEENGDGTHSHVGYLAEGPHDPRPELARNMLEATAGAKKVVMYSPAERERTREDLLKYCERDTWAMVMLLERLRGLVGR